MWPDSRNSIPEGGVKREIQPGDTLIYWNPSLLGYAIAFKTWHKVSHVALYIGKDENGEGRCVEARLNGVNYYPTSYEGVIAVMRPTVPFNLGKALEWFEKGDLSAPEGERVIPRGQHYDWQGILGFLTQGSGKYLAQFCSELWTRLMRWGGIDPFPREDADKVVPFQTLYLPDPPFKAVLIGSKQ